MSLESEVISEVKYSLLEDSMSLVLLCLSRSLRALLMIL
nr:MAG TPA: hypothetical protein [Caudoviricetes sp.]